MVVIAFVLQSLVEGVAMNAQLDSLPTKLEPSVSALQFKRHIALHEKLIGPFKVEAEYYEQRYGLRLSDLARPDYRVPLAAATDFFMRSADVLGDPCFGLTWAQKVPFSLNERIVKTLASAADTRSFFQQNIRLSHLTTEVADYHIERYDDDHQMLTMNLVPDVPSCYHQVDASQLFSIRATRFVLRQRYPDIQKYAQDFTAVLFRHACPLGMQARYEQAFGIPVLFDQPKNGLVMVNEWLDVRLMPGEPSVDDVVACEVERLRLQGRYSLAEIAEQCIQHLLPYSTPSRETIAQALNLSVRTFQRKLKDEDVSFHGLLEQVRKRLAREYIERDCFPLEEVAFLLGYSNITAFYAAYRRWFDATPRARFTS